MIIQEEIFLKPYSRGFHLITAEIINKLPDLPEKGLLNLFVKHTSAGITVNENADPSVREDLENIFNELVPENQDYYTHTMEGSDDMPAHAKSILTSNSITIPIKDFSLDLGTWQGIYLCEFRNKASNRKIIATIYY